jgi:hypothetical protein
MRDFMDSKELGENSRNSFKIEEAAPWYGSKRYDIVDHVLRMQAKKEGTAYRSAVQEAALKA